MDAATFISKWRKVSLTERSASQQHFLDLCELLDHPKPAELDPTGESFTFERGASKSGGGEGWADVWKRGFFGWEYKGKHKNLVAAYQQLLLYREDLENPPLLVVCDMDRIIVHTNFTNTPKTVHTILLDELGWPRNLEILRAVFTQPEKLRPESTSAAITNDAARRIGELAVALRARGMEPHAVAHFLDRIVFCLFAEDIGLLEHAMFSRLLEKTKRDPARFQRVVGDLFEAMATGGDFGAEEIRHFNGDLFNSAEVLALTADEIAMLLQAARLDWSAVDPAIFGTLFERGLDPAKRAQLGAHYTSREDIETLVEPVVLTPLRREWADVRARVEALLAEADGKPKKKADQLRQQADALLHGFMERLASVTVLDPACGSGNFLFVTLQKLKDLEKDVIVYAMDHDFSGFLPDVGPWQLYGIEVNSYAHDLAQMTAWIGYLQWNHANGYSNQDTPILRKMDNFRCMDAILDLSDPDHPREPEWPAAEFIVGNPPFLGGYMLRKQLGDEYMDRLYELYAGRVPQQADLCCYWFERARQQITAGITKRAGLLATQGIRGGVNREVLKRIKESGDIFFAESDRSWVLDGANVHVSMVGFDDASERMKQLDGNQVTVINPNLSNTANITNAVELKVNAGICCRATEKGGSFDISDEIARRLMDSPNPHCMPNSSLIVPWTNSDAILKKPSNLWIIDIPDNYGETEVSLHEDVYNHLLGTVKSERINNRDQRLQQYWWKFRRSGEGMRNAVKALTRFIVTPAVSKHRLFLWASTPLLPDHQLYAFARSDDYFFGVLHSRIHELWARAQGTQLRERESGFRYTPTTCFETFPLPRPTAEQETAIAAAAKTLDELRNNWVNPREWTRTEVLEFPGSADGPWARYVHDADERGIGTVRYPRVVAKDEACAKELAKRTLTNLYNQRPAWLDHAHRTLDAAVFAAYGMDAGMSDDALLAALLELNLARAAEERA